MVRIVIEVPDQHKDVALAAQAMVARVVELGGRGSGGKAIDYAVFERDVAEATAAIERAAHRSLLAGLDIDAPKVLIAGVPHTRVGRYEASFYTMAGAVSLERPIYRSDRERNGKVVDVIVTHLRQQIPGRDACTGAMSRG